MDSDRRRQTSGTSRQPTAWARAIAEFVRGAERFAIPRAELLARAGLTEHDLASLDRRLPLERLYGLVEAMVDLSGDPLAHMRITAEMELASLEALAFAVLTSATLGDGMRVILRFQRLFSEGERYALEEDGELVRLTYEPWGVPRRAHALVAEMFAVDVLVNGRRVVGADFDHPQVSFAHALVGDAAEHRRLLAGIAAKFEQPRCELVLQKSDLDLRIALPGQEPVRAFFERQLEDRVRALTRTSAASAVRDVLARASSLRDGVGTIARRLRVSGRTLQRRLAEEQTSLREIYDEVRRDRAIALLGEGRSISEVADLVGFAETSAFHRAFRRWTGRTPEQHRAHVAARRSR